MRACRAVLLAVGLGLVLPRSAAAQSGPRFDYTPPPAAGPGSAGVTLAVVAPYWSTAGAWTRAGIYADFASALRGDFFELVTARGFTSRGPFPNYQAMLFPDKQGSDLVLVPELDIRISLPRLQKQTEMFSGKVKYKGRATVGGRVNLSLTESLTNERMWSKSIDVPGLAVNFEMKKWLDVEPTDDEVLELVLADRGFRSAITPALDSVYTQVLQTSWEYLNPADLALVRDQAVELRRRKSF